MSRAAHRYLVVAAERAGRLAGQLRRLPGLAGAVCAVAGAGDAWGRPAALGAAAVFLLLLDGRQR